MLTSLHQLLKGTLQHWYQLAGGTLMSVIGLVAAINEWTIPGWVWGTLAYLLFLWAIVSAYHDLRVECDAAMNGLRDRTDHQAIADALTERHAFAKANFFSAGDIQMLREPWLEKVKAWHADVIEIMARYGCTPQEMHHVQGINQLDAKRYSGTKHLPMAILMVEMDHIAEIPPVTRRLPSTSDWRHDLRPSASYRHLGVRT